MNVCVCVKYLLASRVASSQWITCSLLPEPNKEPVKKWRPKPSSFVSLMQRQPGYVSCTACCDHGITQTACSSHVTWMSLLEAAAPPSLCLSRIPCRYTQPAGYRHANNCLACLYAEGMHCQSMMGIFLTTGYVI